MSGRGSFRWGRSILAVAAFTWLVLDSVSSQRAHASFGRVRRFTGELAAHLEGGAQEGEQSQPWHTHSAATRLEGSDAADRTAVADLTGAGQTQSASPSARARRARHWWDSLGRLTLVLVEAEEVYKQNSLRKRAVLGGGNPPWARNSPPPGAPPGPSPFTFIDRWFVATYPCAAETRLGAWGDGGKWVCLSHYPSANAAPVVLSVGSNGDTTFEADIHKTFGVVTHTLDFSLSPEIQGQVSSLDFVKLYRVGLTGSKQKAAYRRKYRKKFFTISEVLYLIGREYVDIFKVDCELCEYELVNDLKQLYTRDSVPFGQIQMEIHRCDDISMTSALLQTLEDLGFRMFHSEINVYGASFNNWQYEVAYIHESLVVPRLGEGS